MAAPVKKSSIENRWEYRLLRKYLLLLATVVATVAYGVGFSPPGCVWEKTAAAADRLAGDPIIRDTSYARYLAFFYCNAAAFALSLVVIVSILLLAVLHEKTEFWITVLALRVVMVLDLLSLMGAFAAGTCRDKFTTIYSSLLVSAVFAYLVVQVLTSLPDKAASASLTNNHGVGEEELIKEKRLRKVLMLLATFAVSITYAAGLSTPGGFWGADGSGRRADLRRHPCSAVKDQPESCQPAWDRMNCRDKEMIYN